VPTGARKPKSVLLCAELMDGRLYAQEESGEIVQANDGAACAFGKSAEDLIGASVWSLYPFTAQRTRDATFEELQRKKSVYLGAFKRRDGTEVELEAALVILDE